MTDPSTSQWPGHEVRDSMLRAVARSAVRQGWRYADGTLFPPSDGEPVVLPNSLQWRAQRRALVALARQGLQTVRPSYEAAPAPSRPEAETPEAGADYQAELYERLTAPHVRSDATGNGQWTLAEARQMLVDGYPLDRVVARTGWGKMWLQDLAQRLATG